MKKWEYNTVRQHHLLSYHELMDLGLDGLEMCGIMVGDLEYIYYFKREKIEKKYDE